MERKLVMTVIGTDRPGLVESVAELVAAHGGNWLESRLSRLGGQFAGMVRVAVPSERESELTSALQQLKSEGLSIVVQADEAKPGNVPPRTSTIEIVAQDRPGIVRQISGALAAKDVNVEDFESECLSAAMTGENLFRARLHVSIPQSCDLAALKRSLEKIAADLIAELKFE